MKSKIFGLILIGLLLPRLVFSSGVGGGGVQDNSIDNKIPGRVFFAEIIDSSQVSLYANRVTWNGKIFFEGLRGKAKVLLPFDKVAKVSFLDQSVRNGYIIGKIKLIDGEEIDIFFDISSKIYGSTSFGSFEIFVRDIQTVNFQAN